ncbi:MAG: sulfotransferase [Deltaproteobacteria bacterium]|nr:sulfotransferase [Deltaproteobacteria bacterium]
MSKLPEWLVVTEEIMAGYTWRNILTLLWVNRFRVPPRYWPRACYALLLATLTTPMRILQGIKLGRIVANTRIEKDPVFIIGNYRTGTTYLITMLSKDRKKGYVSNLLGYTFSFFFAVPRLSRRIVDASLPETRPMDNVKMGSDEPTEEEYCLGTFSKYGYYNGMVFPRSFRAMSRYRSFEGLPDDERRWMRQYDYVVKAITHVYGGKQLFLKNPAIAFRIEAILEMYPNAKFVFTYRNPYTLYASNLHYYRKVVPLYTLQTYDDAMLKEEVLDHYSEMVDTLERTRGLIPEENFLAIRYEDFIQDPMPFMERIYRQFGLPDWEEAREAFHVHWQEQKTYVANRFDLSDEVIETVNRHWDDIREMQGYERLEPSTQGRVRRAIPKPAPEQSAIEGELSA